MTSESGLTRLSPIESAILAIRGQRVILDSDLAAIYGVPTKALNQAVKRNARRFPPDFMFRLVAQEVAHLRSQFAASSSDGSRSQSMTGSVQDMRSQIVTASKRNIRFLPLVFTEHGAIMAANVLNSLQAIEMSVFVVRAFIRMREQLHDRAEMEKCLSGIERTLLAHNVALQDLYRKIRSLLIPPSPPPRRPIGFVVKEKGARYAGRKTRISR